MKKICLEVILFGVIIINNSCNKIFGVNGTYTIRGRFLKDCNGEPIANYGIRLQQKGGLFSESRDLAKDTTDANGYYEFTNIPINNKENFWVLHDGIKWGQVTNWGGTPGSLGNIKDGDVITWNFYGAYEKKTLARININKEHFSLFDTLYLGTLSDFRIIYPINDWVVVSFSDFQNKLTMVVPSLDYTYPIRWAKGKREFDSISKTKAQLFFSKASYCFYPDTSYFIVP